MGRFQGFELKGVIPATLLAFHSDMSIDERVHQQCYAISRLLRRVRTPRLYYFAEISAHLEIVC